MKHSKIFMLLMTLVASYASAKEYDQKTTAELNQNPYLRSIIFYNRAVVCWTEVEKVINSSQKLDDATLTRLAELDPASMNGLSLNDRKNYIKAIITLSRSNPAMKKCFLATLQTQGKYTDKEVEEIIKINNECAKVYQDYSKSIANNQKNS